jgi:hypothetical protein
MRIIAGTASVFVLCATSRYGFAQAPPPSKPFNALLAKISADITNIARERPDIEIPETMKPDVEYLADSFSKPEAAPVHYLAVFNTSDELLVRVAMKQIKSTERAQVVVNDVSSTFSTIAGAVRKSPTNKPEKVKVTVKVVKDNEEKRGWEIFYRDYLSKYSQKETSPESFPQTSTSTHSLLPGWYLFEARNMRGGLTEVKKCEVEGGSDMTCELLVK